MNTYIALFRPEFIEHDDIIRIEADDIWEANEKAIQYLKTQRWGEFKKEDLISVREINTITLVK